METSINQPLVLAAMFCGLAALGHLGCVFFGGEWYRFFGAGEQMAQMAEQGLWYPTIVTLVITAILLLWACYGLSAAGVIRPLPFTRLALIAITGVLLLRGVAFSALMPMFPGNSLTFWYVSSGICFAMGSLFAIGAYQRWAQL